MQLGEAAATVNCPNQRLLGMGYSSSSQSSMLQPSSYAEVGGFTGFFVGLTSWGLCSESRAHQEICLAVSWGPTSYFPHEPNPSSPSWITHQTPREESKGCLLHGTSSKSVSHLSAPGRAKYSQHHISDEGLVSA